MSSKRGLLRQSFCWNRRRVGQSPRSRAESLAWGVSLGQSRFFGISVAAANLSSRSQWRVGTIVFFFPHSTTHGLRKTPKLQVVLLAQVPSLSKSQTLCARESDGKLIFISSAAALTTRMVIRLLWKSLTRTQSHPTMAFLHLVRNLLTLTL